MQRIFVLSQDRKPLMPCLPARARKLLNKGKAKVYRYKYEEGALPPLTEVRGFRAQKIYDFF